MLVKKTRNNAPIDHTKQNKTKKRQNLWHSIAAPRLLFLLGKETTTTKLSLASQPKHLFS